MRHALCSMRFDLALRTRFSIVNKWFDFLPRTRLESSQSIKGRLCWRPGFVLGEDPFVKSGNLEFGTMRIFLKGGCHNG